MKCSATSGEPHPKRSSWNHSQHISSHPRHRGPRAGLLVNLKSSERNLQGRSPSCAARRLKSRARRRATKDLASHRHGEAKPTAGSAANSVHRVLLRALLFR